MQIFFQLGDYWGNKVTCRQNVESKPHGVSQGTGELTMNADDK